MVPTAKKDVSDWYLGKKDWTNVEANQSGLGKQIMVRLERDNFEGRRKLGKVPL